MAQPSSWNRRQGRGRRSTCGRRPQFLTTRSQRNHRSPCEADPHLDRRGSRDGPTWPAASGRSAGNTSGKPVWKACLSPFPLGYSSVSGQAVGTSNMPACRVSRSAREYGSRRMRLFRPRDQLHAEFDRWMVSAFRRLAGRRRPGFRCRRLRRELSEESHAPRNKCRSLLIR